MKLLLVLSLICAVVGSVFILRHPGLAAAVVEQARNAGPLESWNNYLFAAYLAGAVERLALNPQTGSFDFVAAGRELAPGLERAMLAYHEGDFVTAVGIIEREIGRRGESEELFFWLANANLRLAEAENCLAVLLTERGLPVGDHLQRMCTLPIERHHRSRRNTLRAAEIFARLRSANPENRLYLWLLNFTHMTLGRYPASLAVDDRIESRFMDAFYGRRADRVARENSDLVFEDRAAELGIDALDAGKGVAVEDFDGDGDLDIVTGGNFDPLRYYSNVGGTFVDRTEAAGLGGIHQVHIITAADYDGDGGVDLFVGRPFVHYLLLHNNRDGTFSEVTEAAGLLDGWLEDEISFTWASAWGDADGDGDLDLFLARWGMRIPWIGGPFAQPSRGSRLFLNEGDHFVDHTEASGLAPFVRDRGIVGAAWGDADEDGDLDLFLSSVVQRGSYLLRNRGEAGFELAERHGPGFMTAFLDVDHDGRQEIFQGGFTDARTSTEGAVFGEPLGRPAGASSILRRDPVKGRYQPDYEFFDGGGLPIATMGASWGDLDLDGCLDFYLGTGNPEGWFILPNLMFRGLRDGKRCEGRATNVSMVNGFGTIQKGHGIVFFDFDDDGDQDIYSSLGGMWPGDRWPNQMFVNESRIENRWVKIRLNGQHPNRFGVGARITVRAIDARGEAMVRTHTMDHKTGFGSAPYLAHIGLLDAAAIREVRVRWPGARRVCSYPAKLDSLHRLDQAGCRS